MEIKDQFQVSLTGSEYDLLCEVMSFAYSMDFEEHSDDELFNRTWDKISNADHNILFEEVKSWARFLNSIQVCWIRVTASEKSESLPKGIPSESPQIGSTDHTRIIWNPCTIFWTVSKTVLFLSKPGSWNFWELFQFVTRSPNGVGVCV